MTWCVQKNVQGVSRETSLPRLYMQIFDEEEPFLLMNKNMMMTFLGDGFFMVCFTFFCFDIFLFSYEFTMFTPSFYSFQKGFYVFFVLFLHLHERMIFYYGEFWGVQKWVSWKANMIFWFCQFLITNIEVTPLFR